ncbi:hypothetical protein QL285_056999 [Trifolium repens]|nr:hypothetical protein QL285_056999 [Trifolium repens]
MKYSYDGAGSNTKVFLPLRMIIQDSHHLPNLNNPITAIILVVHEDVLCPIDNRAGTLKKMGKLALFFEFVLMGIWMKFVALLGNGG